MTHHMGFPFNDSLRRARGSISVWIRPALDIMAYHMAIDGFRRVMHEYKHSELRSLVNETVVRLDPYKAPEQYHLDVNRITDFLYKELHRDDPAETMSVYDVYPILQELERQELSEDEARAVRSVDPTGEEHCRGCGGHLDEGAHGIIGDGLTCAD